MFTTHLKMYETARVRSDRCGMAVVWLIFSAVISACQPAALAIIDVDEQQLKPNPAPVRILYIGNLCAGCADDHLEEMAGSLNPPRVVEVDSVVIPTY